MSGIDFDELATWAERKRVRAHLSDGRTDAAKCTCAGLNCIKAQMVADYLRRCEGQ